MTDAMRQDVYSVCLRLLRRYDRLDAHKRNILRRGMTLLGFTHKFQELPS